MTNFEKVGKFMRTFGQEVKTKPGFSNDKINKLRIDLIDEELNELKVAINNKDNILTLKKKVQFEEYKAYSNAIRKIFQL